MSDILDQRDRMAREHGAWLDVCQELRDRGCNLNDPQNDALARAMRKWGEWELHSLRLGDPSHDRKALDETRGLYEGRYERGEYPEKR